MNIKKILLISGLILNCNLQASNRRLGIDDIAEITAHVFKDVSGAKKNLIYISQALLLQAYLQGLNRQKFILTGLSYRDVLIGEKSELLKAAYGFGQLKHV